MQTCVEFEHCFFSFFSPQHQSVSRPMSFTQLTQKENGFSFFLPLHILLSPSRDRATPKNTTTHLFSKINPPVSMDAPRKKGRKGLRKEFISGDTLPRCLGISRGRRNNKRTASGLRSMPRFFCIL